MARDGNGRYGRGMGVKRYEADDPREWLNRARNALRLARLREHSDYADDLCHQAQQASEKAIKAVMIARRVRFPYVRDLPVLLGVLGSAGLPAPPDVSVAAAGVSRYFGVRYPGDEPIDDAAYARAIADAECVVAWAASQIDGEADMVREVFAPLYARRALPENASGAPAARVIEDIVARITGAVAPEKIIVFGSAARGTMHESSDLDIMVVIPPASDQTAAHAAIRAALYGCGVAVDLVIATRETVERYGHSWALVYRPALEEGVVVYDDPS